MNTLEIVFGHSLYHTMKQSSLKNNELLLFNVLLNIGDLSDIDNYKINISDELIYEGSNYLFLNEISILKDAIEKNKKIRIWTSHYNIYSYLLMLYICSIIPSNYSKLYVIYSDEYDIGCLSPSMMKETELEQLVNLEHQLSFKEIKSFSYDWIQIKNDNSCLRVIDNREVKSVSIDYYDDLILNTLKKIGKVKVSKLVITLMETVYLIDNLFVYFIKRLIQKQKIKVITLDEERFFDSIIEISN